MSKRYDKMRQVRLHPEVVKRLVDHKKHNRLYSSIPALVNYAVNFWIERQMEKEPK